MHPNRRKGLKAEREVAGLLSDEFGVKVTRRYNLGSPEDLGDLILENTTIQVANYADIGRAIREKLPETVAQQERAGSLFGALFCRRRGGEYLVILTVNQWTTLWREAQPVPYSFGCRVDESGGLDGDASMTTTPQLRNRIDHLADDIGAT